MRARVVRCLLQLATVDLTLCRYDTDGHRSDEHRGCEEACAQRSTEAARLFSEEDNPAARSAALILSGTSSALDVDA
jgi:hypothetical protein